MRTSDGMRWSCLLLVLLAGCGGAGSSTGASGGMGGVIGGASVGGAGGTGGASSCLCRPTPPCPDGWTEYADKGCSIAGCASNAVYRCYQPCATDADCSEPGFPKCRGLIGHIIEGDVYWQEAGCSSLEAAPDCPNPGGYGSASGGCPTGTGGSVSYSETTCVPPLPRCSWARWKVPNPPATGLPNPASYTNLGDGSVRDDVTGLVWQRDVPARTFTWQEAGEYCESLQLAAGKWRLPTRIELVSLVDFTVAPPGPTLDATAFPSTPGDEFWSSSPTVGWSGAWLVNFRDGNTDYESVSENVFRARCVRDVAPTIAPSCHYQVARGEVLDTQTGLIWQQASSTSGMFWSDAQAYCANSGWRAPSIKELQTLVADALAEPAVDRSAFADVASSTEFYWSSSRLAGSPSDVWYVYFAGGYTNHSPMSKDPLSEGQVHVRCVR